MNPIRYMKSSRLFRGLALLALMSLPSAVWPQASAPATDTVLLDVKRFVVEGDNPLSASETEAVLAPHLGQHRSLNTLEAAAKALEAAIRDQGFSFHRVIVPAQRPVGGELKLQVLRFTLHEVTVTGNQHFSTENILRSLPALEPGTSPDIREIGRQLSLANEHPSKRLAIRIKESPKRDALDAEVRARDVPPMQTFVGLTGGTRDVDNTINHNTGYTRLTVGHQQSNLFDRDHTLTLAYTTSPEHVDRVMQLGAFYWLPLYGYHTSLSAYWTKSDVDTGTIGTTGGDFDVSGRGEFWGVRATYALPRMGLVSQLVSVALDDRYFNSDLGFQGTPLPSVNVGSRPLSLRYLARAEMPEGAIGGYVEYLANVGGGRSNDDAAYNNARSGAAKDWEAFRFGLDATYPLAGGWALTGRLRGQYADEALIPGEQFGLGGVGSVRGLRDREVSGDRGYTINLEAHAPRLAWGIVPFVFYDAGYRKHVVPVIGIPPSDSASSAGVGANWAGERKLEVSASLAYVLNGVSLDTAPATDSGHVKLNFSLFYRF